MHLKAEEARAFLLVLGYSLCFLSCLCTNQCEAAQEYPKVSILRWMTAESSDWEFDNLTSEAVSVKETDRETIYTVAQHLIAISVVCNASYPVKWVFSHYDRTGMFNVRIRTYREAGENLFDTKSYKYSATLDMYSDLNKLTGGYSCQSTVSERIRNDIYVYALGNSPPYLVYAGQTLTVKSKDNKTMILPCIVSSAETQVQLYKRVANDFTVEPPSPYIDWDPQVGFKLNMPQMDDPFGNYKCKVENGDDEDDYVLVTAVPGIDTSKRVNNIVQGNASFSFDPVLRQIKCCASGAKSPNLRNIYCEDPITCELRETMVLESGNNGIKFKNSSCTVDRIYYRDSGVFRCKGDGIDVVRHYFSGFGRSEANETSPLYFSWQEADSSKLIDILQHYRPISGKIYSNQTFYMSCDTSYYYYSEGVRWALKWRNSTVQYLNDSYTAYQGYRRSESMRTIKLLADVDMEALECYAPVWNSSEWGKKTLELKIYQSAPPVIVGPTLEELHLVVNQTNVTVVCMTENAKPNPIIRWRKKNRVVIADPNIILRRGNGSSSLTFKRVSHDMQGDYNCLVGNVAGRTNKTVRIIIDIPTSSSWGAASISITVIVVIALLAGIGFLVWKMKLQKKIIDHLAGVVFRDMSGTQATQSNAN